MLATVLSYETKAIRGTKPWEGTYRPENLVRRSLPQRPLDAELQTYISHCDFRCSELRLTQCENLLYLLLVSLLTVVLRAAPTVTVG